MGICSRTRGAVRRGAIGRAGATARREPGPSEIRAFTRAVRASVGRPTINADVRRHPAAAARRCRHRRCSRRCLAAPAEASMARPVLGIATRSRNGGTARGRVERRSSAWSTPSAPARGLTLRRDGDLAQAARRHAADMARRNFFAHASPNGKALSDRVRAAGYGDPARLAAGETSAGAPANARRPTRSSTPGSEPDAPPHPALVRYRELGVGVAAGAPKATTPTSGRDLRHGPGAIRAWIALRA